MSKFISEDVLDKFSDEYLSPSDACHLDFFIKQNASEIGFIDLTKENIPEDGKYVLVKWEPFEKGDIVETYGYFDDGWFFERYIETSSVPARFIKQILILPEDE